MVIAGCASDPHVSALAEELARRATPVVIGSVPELALMGLTWRARDGTSLRVDSDLIELTPDTAVWWRRPDGPAPQSLAPSDRILLLDESAALVLGAFAAAGVRWVDRPGTMDSARLKTVQLNTADRLGARIPETMITSCPEDAVSFSQLIGPVVAKAASSGVGVAPFVDVVPVSALALVEACPTLLQERIQASSDVRVVTIGSRWWVWRRQREVGSPVDWRAADPKGSQFVLTEGLNEAGEMAVAMATALGLTMSAQDWLVDDDGLLFLEVNPQGQWLFLSDAARCVVPALADHLVGHAS